MQQADEKIRRAMEIYYRRNGIRYRKENTKKRGKKIWFLVLFIIICFFGYKYRGYMYNDESRIKIKNFLNTQIDFNKIKRFFYDKENENITNNVENNYIEEENKNEVVTESSDTAVIWPYNGIVTSGFGVRVSDDERVGTDHTGIDIAGNMR